MENNTTKLAIAVKVNIMMMTLLAVLILSGCNKKSEEVKSQTDNTTGEMQSKLDEQQAKIDELQKFKDEQQQANGEIDSLKKNQEESQANQERIKICENKKSVCLDKTKPIQAKIENDKLNIPNEEDSIALYKKNSDKDGVELHKKLLKELQDDITENQNKLNGIINGECKDYQNPCE